MAIPILHRAQVALDCECGITLEACDDEELLDELLEHLAAAHDTGLRRDPAELVVEAWERLASC
jgi:predicted small metal-binding protein